MRPQSESPCFLPCTWGSCSMIPPTIRENARKQAYFRNQNMRFSHPAFHAENLHHLYTGPAPHQNESSQIPRRNRGKSPRTSPSRNTPPRKGGMSTIFRDAGPARGKNLHLRLHQIQAREPLVSLSKLSYRMLFLNSKPVSSAPVWARPWKPHKLPFLVEGRAPFLYETLLETHGTLDTLQLQHEPGQGQPALHTDD